MRMLSTGAKRALLLAAVGFLLAPFTAFGADFDRPQVRTGALLQDSVLQVPARGPFPMTTKLSVGVSKSVLVQFPFELKDVLVSDPERMDAVVQSSNRVFLIAKKVGQRSEERRVGKEW